jgi:hemolysin III
MSPAADRIRASIEEDGHSLYEELANAIVHGVAAVLAGAALALVVVLAAFTGDAKAVVGCAVYGTTLFLVFLSSTLYHGVWHAGAKRIFLAMDHCSIFLLIAGTYTPIALTVFPVASGWALFGVIWGLALTGIVLRLWIGHLHWILLPFFLGMGWLAFAWGGDLYNNMDAGGIWLLISGGFCYTGGLVFYMWRRLRFGHAIWHGFVLAGSVTHFVAIVAYALPEA